MSTTAKFGIFRAEVVATERISPGMQRIVLGGDDLAGFESTGVGDEYLRVFLPAEGGGEPVLPQATEDSWEYPEGVEPSPMRTYTVRGFDPEKSLVTIDFVVHEGGVAATWAMSAAVGDVVGLTSPRGLYEEPEGIAWRILVADATGLPAAARLLEQGRDDVRTRAVLEVTDASHQQDVGGPGAQVTWLYGGNGHGPTRLEEVLRTIDLPSGLGYVWVAGESKVTRAVRKHLRHERKLSADSYKVVGYWIEKAEEWHARYDALDAETRAGLESLWDSDRDEEEIEDEYDAKLEGLGL